MLLYVCLSVVSQISFFIYVSISVCLCRFLSHTLCVCLSVCLCLFSTLILPYWLTGRKASIYLLFLSVSLCQSAYISSSLWLFACLSDCLFLSLSLPPPPNLLSLILSPHPALSHFTLPTSVMKNTHGRKNLKRKRCEHHGLCGLD